MSNDTTTQESTINRVRALLAKADRSEFEAEASAFREKAFEIMMREGISERDIADANSDSFKVVSKAIKLPSTVWRELQHLGVVVAEINGAVLRVTTYNSGSGALNHFYGTAAQVEMCEMMFLALQVQCANACKRRSNKHETPRQFTMGFAVGVRKNYQDAIKTVEADTPGTGLVLKSMSDRINETLGKSRSSRSQAASAGAAGYRAGLSADAGIRQRVEASGRKAIG